MRVEAYVETGCIAAWWWRSRVKKISAPLPLVIEWSLSRCVSKMCVHLMDNVQWADVQKDVNTDIAWCVMWLRKSSILYKNRKTIFCTKFCQLRRYVHEVKIVQRLRRSPFNPSLSWVLSALSPAEIPERVAVIQIMAECSLFLSALVGVQEWKNKEQKKWSK